MSLGEVIHKEVESIEGIANVLMQNSNIRTRKATYDDYEGIAKVLSQSYNIDSIEEGAEVFNKETQKDYNYIVAVAENSQEIVGLITWQMHGLPKHQLCELDRIAVLPEYRKNGVGRKLFQALIEDADKEYREKGKGYRLRKLYLLTHADNVTAQNFYRRLGFRHEATLENHFYDGLDEFVFSRFFGEG